MHSRHGDDSILKSEEIILILNIKIIENDFVINLIDIRRFYQQKKKKKKKVLRGDKGCQGG
jgi:hypothetical protein